MATERSFVPFSRTGLFFYSACRVWRTGILWVMVLDDPDAQLAADATRRLAEQGHPELAVTSDQIARWRKVADALPIDPASRGGGRGRRVRYLSGASEVAAALALALSEDRNLDVAVLRAFGRGAPVAEAGLRASAQHYLRDVEDKAKRAWQRRFAPRSEVPWRQRLPIPESRRSDAALVSDGALAALLDHEPLLGTQGMAVMAEGFFGAEAGDVVAQSRAMRLVLRRMSLAWLRSGAKHLPLEAWEGGATFADAMLGWLDLVGRLEVLTGARFPKQQRLGSVVGLLVEARRRLGLGALPAGVDVALLGLGLGLMTHGSRKRTRSMGELTGALSVELPRFAAMVAAVEALPERWRPAFGFANGPVFIAALPTKEREALMAHVRRWLDGHPDEATVILEAGDGGALPA